MVEEKNNVMSALDLVSSSVVIVRELAKLKTKEKTVKLLLKNVQNVVETEIINVKIVTEMVK
jgi:hypothetical protein